MFATTILQRVVFASQPKQKVSVCRHNAMKKIIMLSATRISLTAYHDEEKYTANNEDHEYKLNNLVKNNIFCTTFLYFRYICIT